MILQLVGLRTETCTLQRLLRMSYTAFSLLYPSFNGIRAIQTTL